MTPGQLITMLICAVLIAGGLVLVSRHLLRSRNAPTAEFAGAPIAIASVVTMINTHRGRQMSFYYDVEFSVAVPGGLPTPAHARILMHPQLRAVVGRGESGGPVPAGHLWRGRAGAGRRPGDRRRGQRRPSGVGTRSASRFAAIETAQPREP